MKKLNALLLGLLFLTGCQTAPTSIEELLTATIGIKVNPYERAPLTALFEFSTQQACKVSIEVLGEHPVKRNFPVQSTSHSIPVLGLYPGRENKVVLSLQTEKGTTLTDTISVQAPALPDFFPTVQVETIDRSRMEPGMHLIDMLIANNGKFHSYTIMFDDAGAIRWYMDMSSTGQITYTNYRLRNGNWLHLNWIDLYEIDDLGNIVRREKLFNNAGDHHIIELGDGRLMMAGSMKDAYVVADGKRHPSRYDAVFIWDREAGRPVKEWDLRQVLDVDRLVYPPDYSPDYRSDWFHINSFDYDPKEESLVISGRNQGVLKVNKDNELQWIMAPHRAWGPAGPEGKGIATAPYLLTAVDANGQPLPAAVQEGRQGTDTFEWSTGQHAVQKLPNGHILLFDNGLMRNFDPRPSYSRAVEYAIDDQKKTIRQVWEYGKQRGLDLYSPITSDVDVLPATNNRLITSGNIRAGALPPHASLVEVTYPNNEVVFEAQVYFKDANGNGKRAWAQFDLVFRGERYPLVQ